MSETPRRRGAFHLFVVALVCGTSALFFNTACHAYVWRVRANVVVGTFRQTHCPPRLLGRVSSASMATNQGTIAIGSALGGFLGSAIGTRPTLWVLTAPLALTWLLLALSPAGKTRELPLAAGPAPHTGPAADAPSPA
ncbi:hypothetical protein ACBR38_03390 [Streptomyces sp. MAD19A]|uniref:hypothetical protein n=1 Tax=Streptomyces TaxID=1883 RepID=UPI003526ECD8|nr:hypothetical protein OG968_33750 [Streptomyces althioticus]WTB97101.1 hypothetical protein OHA53_02100 [Streptomyces althioticus]